MSEKDVRWIQRLNNYKAALARLGEAVELATERKLSDLEKQGLIQAFEFTYELSWKLLKDFFEALGDTGIKAPRDALELASERRLIQQAGALVDAIESRNLASHAYDEKKADQVFHDVVDRYHPAYVELAEKMDKEKETRGL